MVDVILGLGTNKGDRAGYLAQALRLLAEFISNGIQSPVYESAALLPQDAPSEWDKPFLNMALKGECALEPLKLLSSIKSIEARLGRSPSGHWGPREIDIDILAYGQETIEEEALYIPHLHLLQRDFALVPLTDIAPDWVHPAAGKSAAALVKTLQVKLKKLPLELLEASA